MLLLATSDNGGEGFSESVTAVNTANTDIDQNHRYYTIGFTEEFQYAI